MLGRRRAGTTGTPSVTTLPQGTWAPWTATIGTTTSGPAKTWAAWSASNDTACKVGGEGETAMPQSPGRVELEAAAILFGVDHEDPAGADGQVVDIGPATWDG